MTQTIETTGGSQLPSGIQEVDGVLGDLNRRQLPAPRNVIGAIDLIRARLTQEPDNQAMRDRLSEVTTGYATLATQEHAQRDFTAIKSGRNSDLDGARSVWVVWPTGSSYSVNTLDIGFTETHARRISGVFRYLQGPDREMLTQQLGDEHSQQFVGQLRNYLETYLSLVANDESEVQPYHIDQYTDGIHLNDLDLVFPETFNGITDLRQVIPTINRRIHDLRMCQGTWKSLSTQSGISNDQDAFLGKVDGQLEELVTARERLFTKLIPIKNRRVIRSGFAYIREHGVSETDFLDYYCITDRNEERQPTFYAMNIGNASSPQMLRDLLAQCLEQKGSWLKETANKLQDDGDVRLHECLQIMDEELATPQSPTVST
jgi:hypothetical protein